MKKKDNIKKKALLTFYPTYQESLLLKQLFDAIKQEKLKSLDKSLRLRISSYHHPTQWWFNKSFLRGDTKIIITESYDFQIKLSDKEIGNLTFGGGRYFLSRDNLFMIWEVYRKELQEHVKKTKKPLKIVALAPTWILPEHKNGQKICPELTIGYDPKRSTVKGPYYGWSFINDLQNKNIAFCEIYNTVSLHDFERF
jgi:hypothetical protein